MEASVESGTIYVNVEQLTDLFIVDLMQDSFSRKSVHWPDPTALAYSGPFVDDVSRLNPTKVRRVFDVRTNDDIKNVLFMAQEEGAQVSTRGTKHSMGGQ